MKSYVDEQNKNNLLRTKEILSVLPIYVQEYFSARQSNTTTKTRLSYAYDIKNFFIWLKENISELENISTKEIPLNVVSNLTARDIEEYTVYLQTNAEKINHTAGIQRKMASLSSFFEYLYKSDRIVSNPCDKVIKPKARKDRRIIKLSEAEVKELLHAIEYGHPSFTEHQQNYLNKSKTRDLAIVTLLLGTGIRVSECVGLNIKDIDFKNNRIKITRKGGKIQNIPISDEVTESIQGYLLERKKQVVDTDALFLSAKQTRLSVGAVENLVNKYATAIGTSYRITPHNLRKTYGTTLYEKTGDIYLVASALGHDNINTTKEFYARQDEQRLQKARNLVTFKD